MAFRFLEVLEGTLEEAEMILLSKFDFAFNTKHNNKFRDNPLQIHHLDDVYPELRQHIVDSKGTVAGGGARVTWTEPPTCKDAVSYMSAADSQVQQASNNMQGMQGQTPGQAKTAGKYWQANVVASLFC